IISRRVLCSSYPVILDTCFSSGLNNLRVKWIQYNAPQPFDYLVIRKLSCLLYPFSIIEQGSYGSDPSCASMTACVSLPSLSPWKVEELMELGKTFLLRI